MERPGPGAAGPGRAREAREAREAHKARDGVPADGTADAGTPADEDTDETEEQGR